MGVDAHTLLRLTDLTVDFASHEGTVHAVDKVSFAVAPGELVGLVGESGCGKSVTANAILGLTRMVNNATISGTIEFQGRDLVAMPESEVRDIRGKDISMIFQDPVTSLNPVLSIERLMTEGLEVHLDLSHGDAVKRSIELLQLVGIPKAAGRIKDYPHQFSGGMRQRVMIAIALSCNPKLLLADEPTTALDVTIQAQILRLMKQLSREYHAAVIVITHDLGVVAGMCERILVMYAGRIAESGPAKALFGRPHHPYTVGLLRSVPRLNEPRKESLQTIAGLPPDLAHLPPGCSFAPRCWLASEECWQKVPELVPTDAGRLSACFHARQADRRRGDARMSAAPANAAPVAGNGGETLVTVEDLRVHFPITSGIVFRHKVGAVYAVDGIDLKIRRGETLGLVGESGCGKSTTGRAILQLIRPTTGRVLYEGGDLAHLSGGALRRQRRRMQMIFQDPYASLNSRMTVGDIVSEPLLVHKLADRAGRKTRGARAPRDGGHQPQYAQPLPARVQRRAAPAHRHRPGARRGAQLHRLRRAHQRPRRLASARRSSTCSRSCSASSGSPTCSSPTTSPWCATSATAWRSCIWGASSSSPRTPCSTNSPCTPTRRPCFPPCRSPTPWPRRTAARWCSPATCPPRSSRPAAATSTRAARRPARASATSRARSSPKCGPGTGPLAT